MNPFLPSPEAWRIVQACRQHASDLFNAARQLQDSAPHLAYHLATLALEELGKGELVKIRPQEAEEESSWFEKEIEDHVRKLFWALWGPSLTLREKLDRQKMEELRGLANKIHNNRLKAIYVSSDPNTKSTPRDAVAAEEVSLLLRLAEQRLRIVEPAIPTDPDEDDLKLLQWLAASMQGPTNRVASTVSRQFWSGFS